MAVIVGIVLSALVGLVLGMLGGGGSILTVPLLVYVVGLGPHEAIATSLLLVAATSVTALVAHARAGRVRWRHGLVFGLSCMGGAYATGRLAALVPGTLLLAAFGATMLASAFAMMRDRSARSRPAAAPVAAAPLAPSRVVAQGVAIGALTGLVGAGGGFLVVPALVLLGRLGMREAVGTSLLVVAMNALGGLAGHLGATAIDPSLAAAMTLAAVLGSLGGAALGGRVPEATLRRGFGVLVLLVAAFVLCTEVPRVLGHEVSMARDWLAITLAVALAGLAAAIVLLRAHRAGARLARSRDART